MKTQAEDKAKLLSKALTQALDALDLAIETMDDHGWGNYPNTVEKLRAEAASARLLAKGAIVSDEDSR